MRPHRGRHDVRVARADARADERRCAQQLLIARPGTVVTREELRERLRPDGTFVDFEHSLNAAVKRLRAALDDDWRAPRCIETLPRRGYRWIAAPVPRVTAQHVVLSMPSFAFDYRDLTS
ncbi:MAG TPA: helix-turn-helix domain-containing protein [Vicinamibacterales bacterium]